MAGIRAEGALHGAGALLRPLPSARRADTGRGRPDRRALLLRARRAEGYPGGTENCSIFRTLSRDTPKCLAAVRSLIPSRHAKRTLRYSSTVCIPPPSPSPDWATLAEFCSAAAGPPRRYRGLLLHRRFQSPTPCVTRGGQASGERVPGARGEPGFALRRGEGSTRTWPYRSSGSCAAARRLRFAPALRVTRRLPGCIWFTWPQVGFRPSRAKDRQTGCRLVS